MIAIMVLRSTRKSNSAGRGAKERPAIMHHSPYHRIIFSMSMSDILQSTALLVGPFAFPSDVPQGIWAIGNTASCKADGFIFNLGSFSAPMYVLLFCYYCLCKVKFKMTDVEFSRRVEWKAHMLILAFCLGICVSLLITDMLNPASTGGFCTFAAVPTGCRLRPDIFGECYESSAQYSEIYGYIEMFGVNCACFVGVIVCMFQICWHVCITMRKINFQQQESDEERILPYDQQKNNTQEVALNRTTNRLREALERKHRRQFLIQACLYVSVFFLTYGSWMLSYWAIYIDRQAPSFWKIVITSFFFPFGGLLNILVYTRPKVHSLRRKHPDYSRFGAFVLVVKAGGVVPPIIVDHNDDDEDGPASDAAGEQEQLDNLPSIPSTGSQLFSAGFAVSSAGIVSNPVYKKSPESENQMTGRKYYNFPIATIPERAEQLEDEKE